MGFRPMVTRFGPFGVRGGDEIVVNVDEFEAVRLKDLLGMGQEEAAKEMGISQPTFHRLLVSARKKLADAIVSGKQIRIEGGVFEMVGGMRRFRCFDCGHEWEVPYGTGRPVECPKCGSKNIHRHPQDRGPGRGRGPRFGRM